MSGRRRRLVLITAFAALLAFGGAFVEAAFVHTDDGCRVEVHCLACRWAVGTTALTAPVFALAPHHGPGVPLPECPATSPARPTAQNPVSRGPPAA